MLINLKTYAAKGEQQSVKVKLVDRLPGHMNSSCTINCQFDVKAFDNYYVISLNVSSGLTLICQRCLKEFRHPYTNQTVLAVCNSDELAEKMMGHYECVVSTNQIDLKELLTDELYLYSPEFHSEISDCDDEINKFITMEAE